MSTLEMSVKGLRKTKSEALEDKRRAREWRTVSAMLTIYCAQKHGSSTQLCPECKALKDYAFVRLQRCVFGEEKPTCAKCPVHCYQPARREQMRQVMRYSGPQMLWKHPVLTIRHWIDGIGPAPEKP